MSEPGWTQDGTRFGVSQQLSHRVATYVREGIMVGQFPAGEFLRTESLAADLRVSATPVREALMILQSEGSVRWEPRRGFRVVSVSDRDVQLRPGMSATVDIETQTAENVVSVPIQSVTVRAEGGLTSQEFEDKQAKDAQERTGNGPGIVSSRWPRLAPWTVEASNPFA